MSDFDLTNAPTSIDVRGVRIPLEQIDTQCVLYSFPHESGLSFKAWHWPTHVGAEWYIAFAVKRGGIAAEYAMSGHEIDDICDALCAGSFPGDWSLAMSYLAKAEREWNAEIVEGVNV